MDILLLREPKGTPDPYHVALEKLGSVTSFPVLAINFINLEGLGKLSEDEKNFDGIIFTSGNSVKAVKSCVDSNLFMNVDEWRRKKCYVVGTATEKQASDIGFTCSGGNCGNGKALADYIMKDNGGEKLTRLLFPCGQLKREILPDTLRDAGIALKCVTVYETTADRNILSSVQRYRDRVRTPSLIVFFSPSGVNFSLPMFEEVYGTEFGTLHTAAIGQTTAEALAIAGCTPCCVAEKPSPEGLRSSITAFIASLS